MIGTALAVFVFLLRQGYDLVPLVGMLFIGGLFYLVLQRQGLLKNTFLAEGSPHRGVTFADIGGQATAKNELMEAMDFLRNRQRVEHLGIRPLKGILLTGPPGTGKTLLAKAAATYTDSVFIATSGSEFVEMYDGVGAKRVRQLFEQAREKARQQKKKSAILFIDEIEVLGVKRGSHASHLEYDQTLNQLLVEMDGLKSSPEFQLLVIGATNRIDMID